ncbi:MexR antirepressor ArmR [Pseudomonas aeruginosa]|nr:MexR antirepressor ArmR [Pseudomonas aeruginosa]
MSLNTPRNKPSRTETEAVAASSGRSAVGRRDYTEQLRRAARRHAWDLYGEHFY